MDRRSFVGSFAGSLVVPSTAIRGQTPERIWRTGFLAPGAAPGKGTSDPFARDALVSGLAALGHSEGRNLVIEERYADGRLERLPGLAAELVRLPVVAIVVAGPGPLNAARAATTIIPIVTTAASSDPVGEGIVASLARPGGNVTELTYAVSPERLGKQLELHKDAPFLRCRLAGPRHGAVCRTWADPSRRGRRQARTRGCWSRSRFSVRPEWERHSPRCSSSAPTQCW